MSDVFKVPAPVGEVRRGLKRPLSPQASTSTEPQPSTSTEPQPSTSAEPQPSTSAEPWPSTSAAGPSTSAAGPSTSAAGPSTSAAGPSTSSDQPKPGSQPSIDDFYKNKISISTILNSVYSHIDDVVLNDIRQLRGLRLGRRRGRFRKLYQSNYATKFSEALKVLEPLLITEIETQKNQHYLISEGFKHFADMVNELVDNFEGKYHYEFERKVQEVKKKCRAVIERRRARVPEEPDYDGGPFLEHKAANEKAVRLLTLETEAAIEALQNPNGEEEMPNTFGHLIRAFKLD